MSKTELNGNVHYFNPIENETICSPHLAFVPRRCGYELHRQPSAFKIEGLKRGTHVRALFKYTISGEGEFRANGKTYSLFPGNVLLLTGPADYCYRFPKHSEKWEFIFISFWHVQAVAAVEKIVSEHGNVFRIDPEGKAMSGAWSLFESFKNNLEGEDKHSIASTGYDFLMQLCREAASVNTKDSDHEIVREVSSYCFRNMDRLITVDELAELCGYSRWHFSKLFHKLTGMTPSEYMLDVKLEAALRLLRQGHSNIKEIAYRCGFQDQGYFARRFKARFGVSPSHYYEMK